MTRFRGARRSAGRGLAGSCSGSPRRCGERRCRAFDGAFGLKTRDQFITKRLDAVFERFAVLRFPVCLGSRNCALSGEANVQDILFTMSAVTGNVVIREAEFGQRDGSFSGRGVAVGIAPDTIVLWS